MKILKEKILREEEIQDTQVDEIVPEEDMSLINDEEPVAEKTVWKVSFKLGDHENWSRFESETKDEAKQAVTNYITKKWPNREFEIVEIEKLIEEELKEEINESLTDAQPIETGAAVGMASVIGDLIKDEYEAIDAYNSAIATAEVEGFEDAVKVLTEIQAEENIHVGQLLEVMKLFDPNATKVEDGQAEGAEQLSNPAPADNGLEDTPMTEDLDDMDLQDQRMFIKCVNEIWDMSVVEWVQKYHAGQLEVTTVDKYSDIPDASNLIEISATDISKGTGNVVIYTYMDAGDGKLYRYADY